MRQTLLIIILLLVSGHTIFSQNFSQTIRGQVVDQVTQSPIIGANIVVLDMEPPRGAATDVSGFYEIKNVPTGRVSIHVSYIGYEPITLTDLELTSGKELILNFELEENVTQLKELVIVAEDEKSTARNDMSTVSSRQFTVEESQRYAGGRNDVSRMAQNFAGVRGSNDAVNDIVIRGNSPVGLLWRMENIDIPNPNHFGTLGSTGGPVSMLNNNVLANSDFSTGAFPAEYGNALSGVFDLKLRNGNTQNYEFLGQVGFNGFELGAEGPINREKRSSFIANYRYSTLGVLSAMGINFGTGTAVPYYQDISFKVRLPLDEQNVISVFGLGGLSNIDILTSQDTASEVFYSDYRDIYNQTKTGVIGVGYTHLINASSYFNMTVAATSMTSKSVVDSVSYENYEVFDFYSQSFGQDKLQAILYYKKKLNAQHNFETGLRVNNIFFDVQDSISRDQGESYATITSFDGRTWLLQPYVQYQYRPTDRLIFNGGLQGQFLTLNSHHVIEPRLGVKFKISDQDNLAFAYGLHSLMPSAEYYFSTSTDSEGREYLPNTDLDFIKAHHFVLGFDHLFTPTLRAKAELYYQSLFDVVVDRYPSSFSILNAGTFSSSYPDEMKNTGMGTNYGAEITLEKFLDKGLYFLLTGSFYDSKYTASDQIERRTAFAGNYVVNVLAGKEFYLNSSKPNPKYQKAIVFDGKINLAGGQRYTPISLEESIKAGEAVLDTENAFSRQFRDYFRIDVRVAFKLNSKSTTQEFVVDIQNILNRDNPLNQAYDPVAQRIVTSNQLGIFPMMQFRITF